MRDVDQLLRDLSGPPAPTRAPDWPVRWGWYVAPAIVAAASLVFLAHGVGRGTRGVAGPPTVDLRMAVARGGTTVRVDPRSPYHVGERVFFRVATSEPSTVDLWVDGPGGRSPVARFGATSEPADVADAEGLVGWRFDEPGTYTFAASAEGYGVCHGCPVVTLEVE